MANFETPRAQHEGQWSPPQPYWDQPELSVTGGSPSTNDEWTSPPIPPLKSWGYDAPPPGPHPSDDAPEVADPYLYDRHNSRPQSPSSHGNTTLYSPRFPTTGIYLNDKSQTGVDAASATPAKERERTICGIPKRVFVITVASISIFVVVLGLALGLGLGLGLKKKNTSSSDQVEPFCRDHPELCIGGALGAQYYSRKGAFNGSGIALAGESWNEDQHRLFTIYFQHWTGDIRYMQYTIDEKWIGGTRSETIATDAKNATALSTVAYVLNSTQYFHVFYISKTNHVRQKTYTNITNIWSDGSLNQLNLSSYDSPGTVGLQACWQGNFYGDADASKMPTASGDKNTIPFTDKAAMNIWFAVDDSTFQQYAWFNGVSDDWGMLDKWLGKNTHGGVGCYSWGEGTTTYTMMVNKENSTELWWKDVNNTTSTAEHPIQAWRNATKGIIEDVYPSTSLGYTTFFYAQMADRSVRGFNITYQAENTTIADSFAITDPADSVKGLGGTHLTCTAVRKMKGEDELWNSLYVFYQTEGDDITAFTRPMGGGEWSNAKLKIPDE